MIEARRGNKLELVGGCASNDTVGQTQVDAREWVAYIRDLFSSILQTR